MCSDFDAFGQLLLLFTIYKDVLVRCKIGAYKTRALVNVANKERYKSERRLNEQRASGDCGNLE
jgi:hypothetical protein